MGEPTIKVIMKRILMTACILLLIALLCASVVACNDNGSDNDDYNGPNTYEVAKYTVTFNANSDVEMSNNVLTDIPAGSKIAKPDFIPIKKGHEFSCWSTDGSTAFDFDNTTVNKNLTITALFKAKTYEHNVDLNAKLTYDSESDTYTVVKKGYDSDQVALAGKLYSTYNTTNNLNIPTISESLDTFCFWYYIDENGKPVQFSKKLEANATSVAMLAKYTFVEPLTLYPMYSSDLPTIGIEYYDGDTLLDDSNSYYVSEYIPAEEAFIKQDKVDNSGRTYIFNEWYYELEDSDGNKVQYTFEFAEQGKSATSLMSASAISNYFTFGKTLKLYARWQRTIDISSLADYQAVYDSLKIDDPTDEQQAEIDEILGAKITISSDINFGGQQFEPLFDENSVFTGSIDGGTYNGDGKVIKKITLSNGIFAGYTHSSIFGYVNGDILNIDAKNITLSVSKQDDAYAHLTYVGTIATKVRGTLSNCSVSIPIISFDNVNGMVFGGAVALLESATVEDCSVTLPSFSMSGESLVFGTLAGSADAATSILRVDVSANVLSVQTIDDNIAVNGSARLAMGGLVGSNGASISIAKVESFIIGAIISTRDTNIGGLVGSNSGDIKVCAVQAFTLCSLDAPLQMGANIAQVDAIGGFAGRNEGAIVNCYTNANIYVKVTSDKGRVSVGGFVGNNFSDRKDTSTSTTQGVCVINSCYSNGIVNINADSEDVTLDVGTLIGRNSHNKVLNCFTIVDIVITANGTNNIGHVIGVLDKTSAGLKSGWYAQQSVFTLNGEDYVVAQPNEMEKAVDKANFVNSEWIFNKSNTAFSNDVWEVLANGLPTLKQIV